MSARCDRRTLLGRGAFLGGRGQPGWLGARFGLPALSTVVAEEDAHSAEKQLEKLKLVLPKLRPFEGCHPGAGRSGGRTSMCRATSRPRRAKSWSARWARM